MKKIAKFSAILLGVCFGACFMLAGCNGNEHTEHVDEDGDGYCDICEEEMPSTEMALTDGIFDGSIETNPGYIRFHEEGELVEGKAIFYCLFGSENAGTQGAGFYTVEEKDYDYSGSYPSKDDLNEQTNAYPEGSVAQYTITLSRQTMVRKNTASRYTNLPTSKMKTVLSRSYITGRMLTT